MNNNQDNQNINPEMNNLNNLNLSNSRFFNNQNEFNQNQQTPLNVIPQMQQENTGFIPNQNNNFFNNNINTNLDNNLNNNQYNKNPILNNNLNNEITRDSILNNHGIEAFQTQNKYITENQKNTALNDLNVEGEYNGLSKVDYSQDPKVIENIQNEKKKNTITITGEAKVFLIIIAVLLLFTFVMPIIFDFIRDIQY